MRSRCATALLAVVAAVVAGCGSEDFPNDPRPASPVELTARVDNSKVVVAPKKVGAGLATITVSNQSSDNVQLSFKGPQAVKTNSIPAGGVATSKFNLTEGTYRVESDVSSIAGGTLTVGRERPSAQNDLLLP